MSEQAKVEDGFLEAVVGVLVLVLALTLQVGAAVLEAGQEEGLDLLARLGMGLGKNNTFQDSLKLRVI